MAGAFGGNDAPKTMHPERGAWQEMKTIKAQDLTAAAFRKYGDFAKMVEPEGENFGRVFWRDQVQQEFGGASTVSYSTCRVEPRPFVIQAGEYHSHCGEGILPLDGDAYIHVGPATPNGAPAPADRFEVFRVPQGTMVTLRPGIWHMAPFATADKPVNVLVVLPERSYANDCVVARLAEENYVQFEA
jgi:ureidoglycolate lyase